MYPCARPLGNPGEAFRVDAKAEGMTVQVGGWLPARDKEGRIDKARSLWYSAVVTEKNSPRAFDRAGEPFRQIAALEALALLVGFMVFVPLASATTAGRAMAELPAWTDNRGNSFALSRLATTKFPLVCLAMELALQMRARGTRLAVQWAPRDLNEEADALTNLKFEGFTPDLRIPVGLAEVEYQGLRDFLKVGKGFYAEVSTARAAARSGRTGGRAGRGRGGRASGRGRSKLDPLRSRDPW